MTFRYSTRVSTVRLRRWLPRVLAAYLSFSASIAWAQAPVTPPTTPAAPPPPTTPMTPPATSVTPPPTPPTPPVTTATPPLPASKDATVSFVFDEKPWKSVLEWFAKESGLVFYSTSGGMPQGSLTLKTDPSRKYTISQVVDMLNEALAPQNYIIVRRSQTFTVLPADAKLPKDLLPKITLEELQKKGDTELVEVTYTLKFTSPDEIVTQLQKRKGPFGEIYPLGTNQIILQDTAKNVRIIIKDLEHLENTTNDALTYVCKYIKVTTAADLLKNLLSDSSTQVTSATAAAVPGYGGYGGYNYPPPDYGRGGRDSRGSSTPSVGSRFKSVQISTVETTNTIIITAPADKIAAATKFLKEIDVAQPGEPMRVVGPPELRNYGVSAGTADQLAKTLTDVYKSSSVVRITALPTRNEIMVYAPPADHFDIVKLINGQKEVKSSTTIEVIPIVSFRDPKEIVDQLKRMFPDNGTNTVAQMDPVSEPRPGILVKGTQQQIDDIKAAYRAVDGQTTGSVAPGSFQSTTRVIPVTEGNATIIAEALAEMLRKSRSNPIDIKGTTPPSTSPAPAPKSGDSALPRHGVQPIGYQIVDPNQPAQPKSDKKPIRISVIGGNIVIESEDTDALEYATQLARLFLKDATKSVDNRYDILPLKNCSAEEAVKVISELFNGPAAPPAGNQGGGRGGGGRGSGGGGISGALGLLTSFAGIGASAPEAPTPGRIRVVADKQSNSIIVVKASAVDLAMIKLLLEKAIDSTQDMTAESYPKPHYIKLNFARAEEVKATLAEVFSNETSVRSRGAQASPFPFPFPQAQNQGTASSQLTISIDDRSNALIVKCSDPVFKEVEKIVTILDTSAKSANEVVQVIKLEGIDPQLVEDAIRAMSGQQPSTTQRGSGGTSTSPFGGGSNPFSGFGSFGGGQGGGRGGMGTGGRGMGGGTRGNFGGGRGGRNRAPDYQDGGGGRDFFEDRDMDVPSGASAIYDPEDVSQNPPRTLPSTLQTVQYTETAVPVPQPPVSQPPSGVTPPGQPPVIAGSIPAPVDPVVPEAIPNTNLLLLRAKNQADMDAILKFIEFIRKPAEQAQIKVRLIPMKNQDASSIVNILNTLFSRVNLGAGSTTLAAAPTTMGGRPATGFGGGLGALLGFGQQQGQSASTVGNIFMLPLPRFNAIMLAVPESRVADVVKEIERLDVPNSATMAPTPFALKKASAQNVSQQIQTFFNARYGVETQAQNQIRVFFDAEKNTVFVQASPADIKDIAAIIQQLDSDEASRYQHELRVFRLRNAYSDEIAQILFTAITSNAVNPNVSSNASGTAQGVGGTGQIGPFATGGFGGQQTGTTAFGQQQGRANTGFGTTGAAGALGVTAGLATRTASVALFNSQDGKLVAESGMLSDVHITPDARINAIVVSAPSKTMRLVEKLIEELDVPSAISSDVKVFTLKKADATTTATLLQQLFSRTNTGTGGGQQALGGLFGQQGGAANQLGSTRPQLTLTGDVTDGTNLTDLRLSVDTRSNSIIVAGSTSDLDTIRAIVAKLEDSESTQLLTRVYKLRNSAAADIQTALLAFMQQKFQQDATLYQGGVFQTLQRQVFIQPEPVSNTLLIAVAPQFFPELVGLIEKLDAPPPQVFVQVLIAEVVLRNQEEFGMEFGIQSPVLFARSQAGTSPGLPGFNFNTTSASVGGGPGLPNNSSAGQAIVGFQGINNLGVGRSGATGVGGFVFSAASDTFNLLIRALKAQSRVDVLSKPQLLLTDNQTGFFQVGQSFPINNGQTNTANVGITTNITYIDIGITLRVTPRINPDGRVLMRVEPQISNPSPVLINLGNGSVATAFDTETVQTTVLASDGETVVIGGLIRRSDQKTENKIPVLGDIPYLGSAFRFRTQSKERREVIFIVTPTLIRSEADMARVGAVEACKMSWIYKDVMDVNTYGAALLNGQNPYDVAPETHAFTGPPGGGMEAPLPGGIAPDSTSPTVPQQPYGQPLPGGVVPQASRPAPIGMPARGFASTPPIAPAALPENVVKPAGIFRKPEEIWPQTPPASAAPPKTKPVEKPKEGSSWGVWGR